MPKITFSGIAVTEARGSVADQVYSRNRGGNYYRERVTPFYPATPNQVIFTDAMRDYTLIWQQLDPVIQNEWIREANRYKRMNTLDKEYYLSGFNLFISQTFNILLGGGIPSLLPAPKALVRAPVLFTFNTLTTTQIVISIQVAGASVTMPNNNGCLVFMTGSISSGITSKTSGYAGCFSFFPTDSLQNIDITSEYQLVHPPPVLGKKIFARLRVYHQLSGQASQYCYASGIVS